MRVQLPLPSTPPSPPATPKATESISHPEAPATPLDLRERLVRLATSWHVAVPVALCSAALFLWALCYRLPASGNLLKVHARQSPPVETNPPVTAEVLATLREQVRERSMNLIHARREIPALLSKLDAKARELGWRCDASLKAPVTAPGGVQELTLHPVTVELRYDYVEPERAYRHLLAWLWAATTLHPRAEVTSLTLQSLGHGLNAAQVELSFFSLNSNEENPPK